MYGIRKKTRHLNRVLFYSDCAIAKLRARMTQASTVYCLLPTVYCGEAAYQILSNFLRFISSSFFSWTIASITAATVRLKISWTEASESVK